LLLLSPCAGCATFAKREPTASKNTPPAPAVAADPRPAPLPPLTNAPTPTLAITTPSRPDDNVRPASFQQLQPSSDPDPVRRLYLDAATAYAKQGSYIARLRRREFVGGRQKPEEVLMFRFRERPYSVHFKWLSDEGKGREVVYVHGQNDNKLQILTAAGDIPLMPAGQRLSFAPDSPMVRSASHYPITEAGIGSIITRFGKLLDEVGRKQTSGLAVKSIGSIQRPEYPTPLEGVECLFPPAHEPELPQGGKRVLFFDPVTKFPVLSTTTDTDGREVDYYCFDRFQLDVRLDDDDFRTEKLWGAPK
jgi:hypothetical protein